jgi:hypothetical protein
MKIFIYLVLYAMAFSQVLAQDDGQEDLNRQSRFYLVIDYSYFGNDLDLMYMTQHSFWKGEDLGTFKLNQEQVDALNSYVDYDIYFHAPGIRAGVSILNNPERKWYMDANVMIGLSRIISKTYNTNENSEDLLITTENITPWVGMGFNIHADIKNNWGLKLMPEVAYSWSETDEIEDHMMGVIEYFNETRTNKGHYLYSRLGLFATYAWKDLTFLAGPGFYVMYNTHEYTIERINPADGDRYVDIIETKLISGSFMDANAAIEWEINPHFTFYAMFGAGKDLMVHTGFKYNL